MSIEKKKPTKEFYSELDKVVNHLDKAGRQIRSGRQAYDNAIKIAKNQGFDDFEIKTLVKNYLKDKLPRTTLWRYLKELEPIVPLEQISYNNVLHVKHQTVQECLADTVNEFNKLKSVIPEFAEMIEEKINQNIDLEVRDKQKYLNDITDAFDGVKKAILKAASILEKEKYPKENIIAEIKRSYIKLCADEPDIKRIDPDVSYIDYLLYSHYKDKK